MSERLTEERLEKLEKDVRMYYDSGVLAYPVFAIGDILEIITALREERVKHQAARAELEAVREIMTELDTLSEKRRFSREMDYHDWDLAQGRGRFADELERMLDAHDAVGNQHVISEPEAYRAHRKGYDLIPYGQGKRVRVLDKTERGN